MRYDDVHQRYGNHIAKRLQLELSAPEFEHVALEDLIAFLETRAETAHKEYRARLDNPFINGELGASREDYLNLLHRRWSEAEDLAYLISVAEDVSTHARTEASGAEFHK